MTITKENLKELNDYIQEESSFIEVVEVGEDIIKTYRIRLKENKYINAKDHPLNIEKGLKADIENHLRKYGIEVSGWNNTWNVFWII